MFTEIQRENLPDESCVHTQRKKIELIWRSCISFSNKNDSIDFKCSHYTDHGGPGKTMSNYDFTERPANN